MRLIVFSRVFKYRAVILGVALVGALAFFQSNQSLAENTTTPNTDESSNPQPPNQATPSTPQTPETPKTPDPAGTSRISISIKSSEEGSDASVNITPEPQPPIDFKKELKDGNLSITLPMSGDGKFEVNLHSNSRTDTTYEVDQETSIENSNHN